MRFYRKIPLKAFGSNQIIRVTNVSAIKHNYRLFEEKLSATNTICAAVLKSSLHGAKLEFSAPAIYDTGCRIFFVEDISEGIKLRGILPYKDVLIYITGGLLEEEEEYFNRYNLIPCLNDLEQINRWNSWCEENGKGRASIHFDTGMNRMGLPEYEVGELRELFLVLTANFEVDFYMSHFYDIKTEDLSNCCRQAEVLKSFLKGMPKRPISFLSSDSAILLANKGLNFDIARIGIGLVGGGPTINHIIDPSSEMSVEYYAKISQIKKVKKGDTIGYAGAYTAKRDTKIMLAHVGYNDGYLRYLSEMDEKPIGAYMYIAGYRANIVGKVSLGVTTLDVTDIPDDVLATAKCAEIIGPNSDARVLAEISGCFEVFGSLGRPNVKIRDYTEEEIEKIAETVYI